jgi:hypothetical protein
MVIMTTTLLENIAMHYFMITENRNLSWWMDDHDLAKIAEDQDTIIGSKSVKYCNWDHYISTAGWTFPKDGSDA